MLKIYVLFDVVDKKASVPMYCANDESAIRSTKRSFDQGYKNVPGFDHTDFNLLCIGRFYEERPLIEGFTPNEVTFDYTPPKETETNGSTRSTDFPVQ